MNSQDSYTILNLGAGGNVMDESAVEYDCAPTQRLRSRIVVAGEQAEELAVVTNTDPATDDYGLVVRAINTGTTTVVITPPGNPFILFDQIQGVNGNDESAIVTYVVPASGQLQVVGFTGSGNVDGIYRLYIDGDIKLMGYSSVAVPTISLNFQNVSPVLTEGQVVTITGFHSFNGQAKFNATLFGYSN